MGIFEQFTKSAIKQSLSVIGESVSIGGNQFTAGFHESSMMVNRYNFGDSDEVTTEAICLKSELKKEPRINETLARTKNNTLYVILAVHDDVESYRIELREKSA